MTASNLITRLKRRSTNLFWESFFAETLMPYIVQHALRAPKRQLPEPSHVRTVTVWCIDSAGDSLWITPSLRALREGYPHAKITLICNASVRSLFAENPNVDELIPLQASLFCSGRGLLASSAELRRLGRHGADIMLVLEAGVRPADRGRLFARWSGARYCVSSNLGLLKRLSHHTLPPHAGNRYWADYYLDAVRHLGLPVPAPRPEVFPTPANFSRARATLETWIGQGRPRARLLLHPCVAPYGRATKQWQREKFRELAQLAITVRELHILISGSADEMAEATELAREINRDAGRDVASSIAGMFSLLELAALMPACTALVTGDTSVLHLSSAVGLPAIAVFGATNPTSITPPGAQSISARLACQPCHSARDQRPFWPKCIFEKAACLEAISAEQVFTKLTPLLTRTREPELSI